MTDQDKLLLQDKNPRMARNTKDEAQDIVLRQMEKVSRSADRKGDRVNQDDYDSLASQLKRADEYSKLSREQKIALVPSTVWRSKLIKYVMDNNLATHSRISTLLNKRATKFEEFHQKGVSFTEILPYIMEELPNFP